MLCEPSHEAKLEKLVATLQASLETAHREIERLRARVAALDRMKVVVFGSSTKLGVAAVTSESAAGRQLLHETVANFELHKPQLAAAGVGYTVVDSVRVDAGHQTPFKSVGDGESLLA